MFHGALGAVRSAVHFSTDRTQPPDPQGPEWATTLSLPPASMLNPPQFSLKGHFFLMKSELMWVLVGSTGTADLSNRYRESRAERGNCRASVRVQRSIRSRLKGRKEVPTVHGHGASGPSRIYSESAIVSGPTPSRCHLCASFPAC